MIYSMKRILICVALFSGMALTAYGMTSGADFLNIYSDPAINGCGGTLAAAQTISLGRINPALLARSERSAVSFTARPWPGDAFIAAASVLTPVLTNRRAFVLIGIQTFASSGFSFYSWDSAWESAADTQEVDAGLDFGLQLPVPGLTVGAGFHAIHRNLPDEKQYAVYLNAGIAWSGSFLSYRDSLHTNFIVSLSIRNAGTKLMSNQSSASRRLPLALIGGFRYAFYENFSGEMAVSCNWQWFPVSKESVTGIGLNWRLFRFLTLRGGYRFGLDLEGPSAGFGIQVPLGRTMMEMEYAVTPYSDEKYPVHSIAFNLYL